MSIDRNQLTEEAAKKEKEEEMKQQMEEKRQSMLSRILEPDARNRLNRISLVKPDKAKAVENMILGQAQYGLASKITEAQLITLLEKVSEGTAKKTKITIKHKYHMDSDEDEDDGDMDF